MRVASAWAIRMSPGCRPAGAASAWCFQSLALFPHLSVRQNVAFGLRMRGLASADIQNKTREALELVQLSAFADKAPAQLSGGQQQRVALARAFVIEPTVMLLDEPLSALDRKLREAMQVEIRTLARRLGITTIFVTHDQAEALVMSDRIAVMNHGVIEQIDDVQTMFRQPRTAFVAGFMGVSNLLEARYGADGRTLAFVQAPGCSLPAPAPGVAGQCLQIGLRAGGCDPEPARRSGEMEGARRRGDLRRRDLRVGVAARRPSGSAARRGGVSRPATTGAWQHRGDRLADRPVAAVRPAGCAGGSTDAIALAHRLPSTGPKPQSLSRRSRTSPGRSSWRCNTRQCRPQWCSRRRHGRGYIVVPRRGISPRSGVRYCADAVKGT